MFLEHCQHDEKVLLNTKKGIRKDFFFFFSGDQEQLEISLKRKQSSDYMDQFNDYSSRTVNNVGRGLIHYKYGKLDLIPDG